MSNPKTILHENNDGVIMLIYDDGTGVIMTPEDFRELTPAAIAVFVQTRNLRQDLTEEGLQRLKGYL